MATNATEVIVGAKLKKLMTKEGILRVPVRKRILMAVARKAYLGRKGLLLRHFKEEVAATGNDPKYAKWKAKHGFGKTPLRREQNRIFKAITTVNRMFKSVDRKGEKLRIGFANLEDFKNGKTFWPQVLLVGCKKDPARRAWGILNHRDYDDQAVTSVAEEQLAKEIKRINNSR